MNNKFSMILIFLFCFNLIATSDKIAVVAHEPYKKSNVVFLNHEAYAEKHGYEYISYEGLVTDRFKDLDSEFGMYTRGYPWQKFAAIKKAFSETEAEWVLWVSSDTLFVNMDFEIESLIEAHPGRNLIVFEPKEPINGCIYEDSGIFLIRNSEFSLNFLKQVGNLFHVDGYTGSVGERVAMQHVAFRLSVEAESKIAFMDQGDQKKLADVYSWESECKASGFVCQFGIGFSQQRFQQQAMQKVSTQLSGTSEKFRGDFWKTCTITSENEEFISATCFNGKGYERQTILGLPCNGHIKNIRGDLQCVLSGPLSEDVLGNYWKSCHNIELDENNRLTATCRCCDKHEYETKFVESSLKVPCEEDSYVEVVKGELKCGKMGTQECGIFMKIFGDCKTKIFVEDEVDADNSEL